VPYNAQQIRNLMIAAQYVHDHVMHFYHLHALDWVDVVSALSADPKKTSELAQSISPYGRSSPGLFADVQKRVKTLVESGQLGIFANAYWGHPGYKLPPEANLMAVSHYLDALQWQREVAQIHAIFGGKNPHPMFLVGGVPSPIDLNSDSALNMKRLSQVGDLIAQMRKFVDEVYVPDTLAIASFYKDWGAQGEGLGNFMTFGDFPTTQMNDLDKLMLPRGAILNRDLSTIHEVDLRAEQEVEEYVSRSWYDYSGGKDVGLHPWKGETTLNYTGPKPPYTQLDVEQAYSWLKSPRWRGKAIEVGRSRAA
jgi:hydrogenase large subunit